MWSDILKGKILFVLSYKGFGQWSPSFRRIVPLVGAATNVIKNGVTKYISRDNVHGQTQTRQIAAARSGACVNALHILSTPAPCNSQPNCQIIFVQASEGYRGALPLSDLALLHHKMLPSPDCCRRSHFDVFLNICLIQNRHKGNHLPCKSLALEAMWFNALQTAVKKSLNLMYM